MQFTVSSTTLAKQLAAINGVIVSNPVVPILENFLFEVKDKQLTITASDLQTAVATELAVETAANTRIALPARLLLETLRNLPEQPVTFSVDEQTYGARISAAHGEYRLAGENATDFPQLKMGAEITHVTIAPQVLKKAIQQAIVAASNEELKPAMNGIYINFNEKNATFVATDGHRLVRHTRKDVSVAAQKPFIVPRKPLMLLNALLAHEEQPVAIALNDNFVHFKLANLSMLTRLVDERFPDYEQVIPADNPNKLTVDRPRLLSSLKRMAIYANRTTNQIKLSITDRELKLVAEDLDFANEAKELLPCSYEGKDLTIGFNVKFLIEMLSNLATAEVEMHFAAPNKASLLLPKEKEQDEDVLQLLMPVILK